MKKTAFTLIELLVVISIIALLIGILVPVLQTIRQTAKALVCSTNIKKLNLAMKLYEEKNQAFPYGFFETMNEPPGEFAGDSIFDKMGLWWFNYIGDYTRDNKDGFPEIWCPSRNIINPDLETNVLCGNYGVNQSICKSKGIFQVIKNEFTGMPLSSDRIEHPDKTLLIIDSGYSVINWCCVSDSSTVQIDNSIKKSAYIPGLEINEDKELRPGLEEDAIKGRHPNKTVNAGFVDGHISRMKAADFLVEKIDDTYENKTPLWKP